MGAESGSMIIMIVLMFAVMYFLMIRPENKRKKKAQEMRDNLKKGDTITSIGGIVGKIVQVGKDTIVIETSDDRVRMELTKWRVPIVQVMKIHFLPLRCAKFDNLFASFFIKDLNSPSNMFAGL